MEIQASASITSSVLLIEDEPTTAKIEQALLESLGCVVRVAQDGMQGLKQLESWQPDLIVLDLNLPDMSGLEILAKICDRKQERHADILIVTGDDDHQSAVQALELGANDLLRKPFVHAEFRLRVKALLAMQNYRKAVSNLQHKAQDDLRKLSKYFSRDLIAAILDGTISTEPGGHIVRGTFMMFDLRGSTTLAERLGPQRFFVFLSELFSDLSDLIFSNGGTINKYTGDGFLVTFGLRSYSPHATRNAITCAMKIREHFRLYNDFIASEFGETIHYGIGIATGEVFAGNIGNVHRVEYTILGDPVNLSARLETLTKRAGVDILIDSETRHLLGSQLECKKLRESSVRGKSEKVEIYFPEMLHETIA
ncbi:MAG: response regulator [Spirochaetota bacterium]